MVVPIVPSVNLKAYCMAFEALGDDSVTGKNYADGICNSLHTDWKRADKDVLIYFDKKGSIAVPEYGTILGQRQIARWNSLSFNDRKGIEEKRLSPELVSYFIAGAFSLNALPYESLSGLSPREDPWGRKTPKALFYRENLDQKLVEGINELYGITKERGHSKAMQSNTASNVQIGWNMLQGCRDNSDQFDKLNCEFAELISRINYLEGLIEESTLRDIYEGLVRPYKRIIKTPADDDDKMKEMITAAQDIIVIAMRHQQGEEAREKRILLLELKSVYNHLVADIRRNKAMPELEKAEKLIGRQNRKDKSLDGQIRTVKSKIQAAEEILKRNHEQVEKSEGATVEQVNQ